MATVFTPAAAAAAAHDNDRDNYPQFYTMNGHSSALKGCRPADRRRNPESVQHELTQSAATGHVPVTCALAAGPVTYALTAPGSSRGRPARDCFLVVTAAMAAAIAAAAEEEAIIRQRLLTRTTVTRGEPPLRKLLKRFTAFAAAVDNEKTSVKDCAKACEAFLRELDFYYLSLERTDSVKDANKREQQNFVKLREILAGSIESEQAEIESLKLQLEDAKLTRQHKEECEAIRRLIAAEPAREVSQKAISVLEADIAGLERECLSITKTLDLRRKQFALLLHAVEELQSEIGIGPQSEDATSSAGLVAPSSFASALPPTAAQGSAGPPAHPPGAVTVIDVPDDDVGATPMDAS
ncbi:hypothetical protein CBR_g51237 [Chara braunii]|uniref:THO complex subunit 7 n=1 Tax=Chara braunii TaxID=69332 RepID=A0A388M854_CHABU|nr:hypothetical protein CBR_g51237 [Chara braunii]|eukprot:GBG90730.1 hypothetical protein CBR_g51237 [Chara braunii]